LTFTLERGPSGSKRCREAQPPQLWSSSRRLRSRCYVLTLRAFASKIELVSLPSMSIEPAAEFWPPGRSI
jgi:hypothetical protein